MIKYKVVEGPMSIDVSKHGGAGEACEAYATIINNETAGGWKYHSLQTITFTKKPGCMQKPVPMNCYMLIFVKET